MKLLSTAVLGLSLVALSNPSSAQTQVVFEGYVGERIDALNALEQRYEERFRKFRHTDRGATRSSFRLNKARFFKTEWAGERLIENVDDFTAEKLIQALVGDLGDALQSLAPGGMSRHLDASQQLE